MMKIYDELSDEVKKCYVGLLRELASIEYNMSNKKLKENVDFVKKAIVYAMYDLDSCVITEIM